MELIDMLCAAGFVSTAGWAISVTVKDLVQFFKGTYNEEPARILEGTQLIQQESLSQASWLYPTRRGN